MNRFKKVSIPATIAAASVLVLAGCGASTSGNTSGGGATSNSGSNSTAATSNGASNSSSSSSANQNDLLAQVMKTHTISIAESAFAPQDFQDPNTKKWTGYDVDILRGFAKSLGATLKIDAMPFSASIQAVADKRDDLTIDIYQTKKRAKVLSFSRPMLNYNDVIVVNSQNPTVKSTDLASLKGKKIAVVVGSAEEPEAKNIPGAIVKEYSNIAECFLALSSGRVDATIQPDTDPAWSKHKNSSLKIKTLGAIPSAIAPPVQGLRGYYGVPKGSYSTRFLDKLNAYLKKIASDGTEQKILDNYNMTSPVFLKGIASAPNSWNPNQ